MSPGNTLTVSILPREIADERLGQEPAKGSARRCRPGSGDPGPDRAVLQDRRGVRRRQGAIARPDRANDHRPGHRRGHEPADPGRQARPEPNDSSQTDGRVRARIAAASILTADSLPVRHSNRRPSDRTVECLVHIALLPPHTMCILPRHSMSPPTQRIQLRNVKPPIAWVIKWTVVHYMDHYPWEAAGCGQCRTLTHKYLVDYERYVHSSRCLVPGMAVA